MPASVLVACAACARPNRLAPERLADAGNCGACGVPLPPLGTPIGVERAVHLQELLDTSAVPVLVDFWAPWCVPCVALAADVQRVAARHAGRLLIVKANIDADPATAQLHRIMSVPTLAVFEDGVELDRQIGALPAKHIEEWVAASLRHAVG